MATDQNIALVKMIRRASNLIDAGDLVEAETQCKQAYDLAPENAELLLQCGRLRYMQHRLESSINLLEQALKINPAHPDIRTMLFASYKDNNDIEHMLELATIFSDEAVSENEMALAYTAYLRICDWKSASMLESGIMDAAMQGKIDAQLLPAILLESNAMPGLSPEQVFKLHKRWASTVEKGHACTAPATIQGRIRIAYISGDFFHHPVGYFSYPIITSHNRNNFEVFCYAQLGGRSADDVTKQFEQAADHFTDITHMDNQALAARLRQDDIHIAVDLSSHTSNSRTSAFALRLAPVQISYLGYPNTSGLAAMDFHITDHFAEAQEQGTKYTEELLFMPNSFLCYTMEWNHEKKNNAPCEDSGLITFACFNDSRKLNPEVIKVWSHILKQVENSRLLFKFTGSDHPVIQCNIIELFETNGIDPNRIQFLKRTEKPGSHLLAYHDVDISLDPFPYTGTTTTCESLSQGVPVLTLVGPTHANRVSCSILKNIGFEETIAYNSSEYIDKAVKLANNPKALSMLRTTLPLLLQHSPLRQTGQFIEDLEALYRLACEKKGISLIPSETDHAKEHSGTTSVTANQSHSNPHASIKMGNTEPLVQFPETVKPADRASSAAIMEKPALRIIHNMARSGSTLICKCLGCMENINLLSEIHPAAVNRFNPLDQAHTWFQLFNPDDIQCLQKDSVSFEDAIELIELRCRQRGETLVLRDWGHLDYTGLPFLKNPTYTPELADALKNKFNLVQTAIVRHPIDQWLSLRHLPIMNECINRNELTIQLFLDGFLEFARACYRTGYIRYEDFTQQPETVMQQICSNLDLHYDPDFINHWSNYSSITGDVKSTRGGDKIRPLKRRQFEVELLTAFESKPTYREILKLLEYPLS